jgi:HAMP domain-containing protein
LIVAEQGRTWGWGSAGSIALYVIGAVGIAGFIVSEKLMGDAALIPLKLFKNATFSMATVLGVLVGFGMFGAMLTIPLYLQLVNGATPTESGFLMLPMILGLMISSIVSGQIIARTGIYKWFPRVGTAFMSFGFLWFTFASIDKPVWFMMIGMLLIGLGLGQLMQTLTIASQNSVGPRDIGVATSSSTFFRQIGGTLGVAVLFSVLFTRLTDTVQTAFGRTGLLRSALDAALDPTVADAPQNAAVMDQIYAPIVGGITANLPAGTDLSVEATRSAVVDQALPLIQDTLANGGGDGSGASSLGGDTSFLNGADPRLTAPFLEGFNNAAVTVFWVALGIVLVAFLLSWFLRTAPLRAKSALQENADNDAALLAQAAASETGAMLAPDLGSTDTPELARK